MNPFLQKFIVSALLMLTGVIIACLSEDYNIFASILMGLALLECFLACVDYVKSRKRKP